jgi:hypothetical protein
MSATTLRAKIDEHRCPICSDIYTLPVRTPCGHTFCTKCLRKSLQPQRTCPCCRTDLTKDGWFNLFRADASIFVDRPLSARCEQIRGDVEMGNKELCRSPRKRQCFLLVIDNCFLCCCLVFLWLCFCLWYFFGK